MLRRLAIRDFVIVDRLELEFDGGFGALTGETGAGKSILVDALALALGERAEAVVVREGSERAEVAVEFDVAADGPVVQWLRANDFSDEGCLIRRVVDAGGRSRAYVNGSAATAGQLRELADFLADIHGQHAFHSLLRAEAQRNLLDAHGHLTDQAREVATRHREWRTLAEARQRAESGADALRREKEALEWQLKELADLDFEPRRWDEDNQEHRRLGHAAALLEGAQSALVVLDEGDGAIGGQLDRVCALLAPLKDFDSQMAEPAELLETARIQLQEASHALARYRDRLDLDPGRLAELEQRIAAVTALARKHRLTPEELPALRESLARRLETLAGDADPEVLARREVEAKQAYLNSAQALSRERTKTAEALAAGVTEAMQQLAMAGGRFEIALEPLAEGASYGLEAIEFRVAANPGQGLRPLAKAASGGELSRIGLAIQVIASRAGRAPTLIFDEVDVGIGGSVAEVVGRMLRQLSADRQVLCVTHLPQVAAQAHWQWSIAKETRQGATLSKVTALDADGRVDEIARMLGGVKITDTTRRHAREMLKGG